MTDHAMHLVVVDERTVDALRDAGASRQVQHIAMPEQRLRTHLVEDGARIDARRHLEGDAGRDVGLYQTGDHID